MLLRLLLLRQPCLLANLPPTLTLMNSLLLQEGVIPSIQLQLQEVKRGKARQFFGLMGKRVGGEFFGLMGRQAGTQQ